MAWYTAAQARPESPRDPADTQPQPGSFSLVDAGQEAPREEAPAAELQVDARDFAISAGEDKEAEEGPAIDTTRLYMHRIGQVALLNAEQEVDLAKRIEAGLFAAHKLEMARKGEAEIPSELAGELELIAADGVRAKHHMLEANLRLVVSIAKRYQGKGLDLQDLIQEGNIGLTRAVEKFDYAKGYKFSTYASWWIRQAIQRGLADQSRTIRVPVHMVEKISKVVRARRNLANELGRKPSLEEISQVLGQPPEVIEELLNYGRPLVSLDETVGEDGEDGLGELIADKKQRDVADTVVEKLIAEQLTGALAMLPERTRRIMELRFGLHDGEPRTLDEVGKAVGLTRERIRQIERQVLRYMGKPGSPFSRLEDYIPTKPKYK